MPTYQYRCRSCGHEFDEFQSITADPLVVCPQCAQPTLHRVLGTGGGMIFKGSGFYLTDYKKTSSSPNSGNSGKPEKPKPSASNAKPESE